MLRPKSRPKNPPAPIFVAREEGGRLPPPPSYNQPPIVKYERRAAPLSHSPKFFLTLLPYKSTPTLTTCTKSLHTQAHASCCKYIWFPLRLRKTSSTVFFSSLSFFPVSSNCWSIIGPEIHFAHLLHLVARQVRSIPSAASPSPREADPFAGLYELPHSQLKLLSIPSIL